MYDLIVHYALGNIPAWVWPATAGGAAVIYFFAGVISHIPEISLYAKLVKPAAFVAMLIGVFMYGGQGVVAVYKADLKDAEHKAELAEQKSLAATQQLATELKNKEHLIKGRAYGVKQTIEVNRTVIDSECKLSDVAWMLYNSASQNKVADSFRGNAPATGQPKITQ